MIVIADTSPIHYLVLVGHVDVLQKLYKRVLIPGAVAMELQAASTPPAVKAWITAAPDWIEVRTVTHPDEPALTDLDPGEREAIVLAEHVSADAVIIDDRAGRQEAQRRHLRVIGTVRVLDDAAEAGLLNPIVALDKLQAAGFYLDAGLVAFARGRRRYDWQLRPLAGSSAGAAAVRSQIRLVKSGLRLDRQQALRDVTPYASPHLITCYVS